MEEQNNMRRFPSDSEELKRPEYKDTLYAALQTLSNWNTGENYRYVKYKGSKKVTKTQLATFANISRPTVDAQLKKLEEIGYIAYRDDYIILPNVGEKYFKIPYDTLNYMSKTFVQNVIKVYTYLGRMWEYYILGGNGKEVVFTENVLLEVIGLNATKGDNHETIRFILLNLENNGLIGYSKKGTAMGNQVYILTAFSTEVKNFREAGRYEEASRREGSE